MYWIVLILIISLVSFLITRVTTVALTVTGMAKESARFQARSAVSGVGFTTSESEAVVNHPLRRRIVMTPTIDDQPNPTRENHDDHIR